MSLPTSFVIEYFSRTTIKFTRKPWPATSLLVRFSFIVIILPFANLTSKSELLQISIQHGWDTAEWYVGLIADMIGAVFRFGIKSAKLANKLIAPATAGWLEHKIFAEWTNQIFFLVLDLFDSQSLRHAVR